MTSNDFDIWGLEIIVERYVFLLKKIQTQNGVMVIVGPLWGSIQYAAPNVIMNF